MDIVTQASCWLFCIKYADVLSKPLAELNETDATREVQLGHTVEDEQLKRDLTSVHESLSHAAYRHMFFNRRSAINLDDVVYASQAIGCEDKTAAALREYLIDRCTTPGLYNNPQAETLETDVKAPDKCFNPETVEAQQTLTISDTEMEKEGNNPSEVVKLQPTNQAVIDILDGILELSKICVGDSIHYRKSLRYNQERHRTCRPETVLYLHT